MTTVKPLGENVLVKPEKSAKKTESGLYLPESASAEKPQQGKIMAVGDSEKIKVKKNQKVIFRKYAETEVKIDNEDYYIIKNSDILAVIE